MNLTASDRSSLIRLASSLPKGSDERRAILAGLTKTSSIDWESLREWTDAILAKYPSVSGWKTWREPSAGATASPKSWRDEESVSFAFHPSEEEYFRSGRPTLWTTIGGVQTALPVAVRWTGDFEKDSKTWLKIMEKGISMAELRKL